MAEKLLNKLFHQREGILTQRLVQEPGKFGLGKIPQNQQPDRTTTTVCGFCSTGCGLKVHLKDGKAVNLTPDPNYPVNLGKACPKGWEALTPLAAHDRAVSPMLKNSSGKLRPVDWPTALTTFRQQFTDIIEKHGSHAVAFISTGQIPTEEMALLGAVAKFGMGMVHGDGNTRQCMATAVVAYKQSFGFDAPPYTYADFEESDVIVLIGSNLCIAHPIMWERICRNPHNPEIIVVDPRRTETAIAGTTHLPIKPKSDLALFYGIAHILINKKWIDTDFISKFTTGFEDFSQQVSRFTPVKTAAITGISAEKLNNLAKSIHNGKRVSFWWTMGVNQSHEGVNVAQAIINLALMTGNMGRPGTGANSITGQCNAMGSRLFSNTTSLFAGRDFNNDKHRQQVADILEIPTDHIPTENSWAYDQIIEAVGAGIIKGLWIIATNTSHSWIHQNHLQKVLNQLDFLVVQDMYATTETAQCADLLLPAAGWGEKEGTFINSERRIGLTKKVTIPPGKALPDFDIFKLIATAWGNNTLFSKWESPEATFQILKNLSKDTPCDFSGIVDYQEIDERNGIQWPYPEHKKDHVMEKRLFENGEYYHPDKKAKFCFAEPREIPEKVNNEFPLILLTGRGSASQWHTETRTSKSAVLNKLYPENIYAEIHPADAEAYEIKDSRWIWVASMRGQIKVRAFLTTTVQRGHIFIPMHYPTANQLTYPAFDLQSRQPAYKFSAVKIFPI